MEVKGECDFCGKEGEWEVGLFDNKVRAKSRPATWAAMFPWNRLMMPKGCTFDPSTLEKYGVTTRLACPDCWRE